VGVCGFKNPNDKTEYSWPPQAGVDTVNVSRSDDGEFVTGCRSWSSPATFIHDAEIPLPGRAFYYLNRPESPSPGSWGEDSKGAQRAGSCL
jgi:hypothetical protein